MHQSDGEGTVDETNVIDFAAKQQERVEREGMTAHEQGQAFALRPWHFQGDPENREAPPSVGLMDPSPCSCGAALEVIIFTDPPLTGITMSREDARKLAHDLLATADMKAEA